ncbi:sulfotransferase [uncultured Roseobacter sp.]|uniref:sulfotransferase family protein n=1 Tax=uncultured Roseobacter sp. TaxID=114847 RepID=UPI0026075DE7|nr:sulfotransferase [uncultured Roseobacter sp.]
MVEITSRSVVVYGALRSGTTLLRLMLDAHPRLSCPGETDFIFDHLRPGAQFSGYDMDALQRERIYRNHEALYPENPLPAPTPDAFIDRIARDDSIAVLMLHRNLHRVLELYPQMRVIHMLRDPRDVARSSIGMGWAGTVYHGVDHWIGTMQSWKAAQPRLPSEQVLQISYEQLIKAPEKTLEEISTFCGLPYDPGMLTYDANSTYDKPDPSLVTQWRHKQTPYEVGLVEHKIGALLTEAGYAPSGFPAQDPGLLERFSLGLRNRRATWAKRIKRYGLRDPLIVALCRRLGMPHYAAGAQRRIDEKLTRLLK